MAPQTDDGQALHEDILQRGALFASLFYFLLTAFALSVLAALMRGIPAADPLALGYALVFGGLATHLLRRHDLRGTLLTVFLPLYTLSTALLLASLASLTELVGGPAVAAPLVGGAFLLMGAVPAYLLRELSDDILHYLAVPLYESSVIGVLTGLLSVVRTLQDGAPSPRILLKGADAVAGAVDPTVLFILLSTLFSAPFVMYARRRDDATPALFALALVPLVLHAIVPFFLQALL